MPMTNGCCKRQGEPIVAIDSARPNASTQGFGPDGTVRAWIILMSGRPVHVDQVYLKLFGPFGTIVMIAHDWDDPTFHNRSMQLMAEQVMSLLNDHGLSKETFHHRWEPANGGRQDSDISRPGEVVRSSSEIFHLI